MGVSDVELAARCREAGIPCSGGLEDLAHWADGGDLVDALVDITHVGGE